MREKYLPLAATVAVFAILFLTGGYLYNNFLSTLVLGDILADNAFVIIAAIGTTFVILSGGIDLSIGSMIGFVGVAMANLDQIGWHPLASALVMLAFGAGFGALQGLHHRLLRNSAFHDYPRRVVPAARGVFHDQPRFGAPAPSLRRGLRRREHPFARRRVSGEFSDRHVDRARRRDTDRALDRLRRGCLCDRRRPVVGRADGRADATHNGQNIRDRRVV